MKILHFCSNIIADYLWFLKSTSVYLILPSSRCERDRKRANRMLVQGLVIVSKWEKTRLCAAIAVIRKSTFDRRSKRENPSQNVFRWTNHIVVLLKNWPVEYGDRGEYSNCAVGGLYTFTNEKKSWKCRVIFTAEIPLWVWSSWKMSVLRTINLILTHLFRKPHQQCFLQNDLLYLQDLISAYFEWLCHDNSLIIVQIRSWVVD